MRITNSYLSKPQVDPLGGSAAPQPVTRRAEDAAALDENSRHIPSPELLHLLDQVRKQPAVRSEILQRIAKRLAEGHYLTWTAAEETAEAILRAYE